MRLAVYSRRAPSWFFLAENFHDAAPEDHRPERVAIEATCASVEPSSDSTSDWNRIGQRPLSKFFFAICGERAPRPLAQDGMLPLSHRDEGAMGMDLKQGGTARV